MKWREHLQARLLAIQPAAVCALDPAAQRLASEALKEAVVQLQENSSAQRYELALGVDALDGLNVQQAEHLISRTRLYIAPRILLVARADCALTEEMFIALGFTLSATDTTENVRIHYYDLDTYKTVPDWLNARHWANPERWQP